MPLFPEKSKCEKKIEKFNKGIKTSKDSQDLEYVFGQMLRYQNAATLFDVQPIVLNLLGRWGAYRYKPANKANKHFLEFLASKDSIVTTLFDIVNLVAKANELQEILKSKRHIEQIYNFLRESLLLGEIPARIVTVSKTMLIITGLSPGLDSRVLKAIKLSTPQALACPGVWSFHLYFEHLEFVAKEQIEWEKSCGSMRKLLPDIPIGQIMDRILWTRA